MTDKVPEDYKNGVWIDEYTVPKAENARLTEPMNRKLDKKKVPMIIFENVTLETHVDTRFDVDPATRGTFQVRTENKKHFGLWLDHYERILTRKDQWKNF